MNQIPKILIIEDSKLVALELKHTLQPLGYMIMEILSSGEDCLHYLKNHQPDLILMDIILAGEMDGIETCIELKKSYDIPVIYLSSISDQKTFERATQTDPYGYLIKPVKKEELAITLAVALHKYQAEKKIKQRESYLSGILKSIGDAVIVTDNNSRITFMNPIAEAITGWKQEVAYNRSINDIFKPLTNYISHITTNPITMSAENNDLLWMVKQSMTIEKDNIKRNVEHSVTPITDNSDNILGSIIVFRDITDKQLIEGMVNAMAMTVDMKDPFTSGHQKRVAVLAREIALTIGLSVDQIEGVYIGGLIHDIGKISIPSEILTKPRTLDPLEFNIVKSHPDIGYEILNTIPFPWPVPDMAKQHHERIDGSGYPEGRIRDEIILEAKITAVADVVEAMTFHRPYRPALGIESALEEINNFKGILYDKEVVKACQYLFKDRKFAFSD